ncbi:MAG TPA: hemolysin family protein, partial [Candidatus Caenarcaniphilales bacterium]
MNGLSSLLIGSKLIAVVVLVLANGFFVAAEFSLVSVRRSRVEQLIEEGHPQAKALKRAVINLDSYLAATQLGITMASLGLGWLGEPAIAALIEPAFHILPESLARAGSHTLAVLIAFTIITALHIVLGELAPKSLALQQPEKTALFSVKPLELYLAIFSPAVHFLNSLGNFVLVLLGLRTGTSEEFIHSPDELRLLVSASHRAGLLGDVEEDVVERVFRVGEQRVSAFMTPRRDIVWLDIDEPLDKLLKKLTTSVHSRFLVCQGSI